MLPQFVSIFLILASVSLLGTRTQASETVETAPIPLKLPEGIKSEITKVENYAELRLVYGRLRKINGQVAGEQERFLTDTRQWLQTVTYQAPVKTHDVFHHLLNQLKSHNLKEVYTCQARDCGPSHLWASEVFKQRQLYGLDRYQYYWVGQSKQDSGLHLILYVIQRGNRQVIAHIRQIRSQSDKPQLSESSQTAAQETAQISVSADEIGKALNQNGVWQGAWFHIPKEVAISTTAAVYRGRQDPKQTQVFLMAERLAKVIQKRPKNRFVLVLQHSTGKGSWVNQLNESKRQAKDLVRAIRLKLPRSEHRRVESIGIGPALMHPKFEEKVKSDQPYQLLKQQNILMTIYQTS